MGIRIGLCGTGLFADPFIPPNHVWAAARYLASGLIAHSSAMDGSILLEAPDYGDPVQERLQLAENDTPLVKWPR